ncbi:MAG: hypothetical protein KC502_20880 [Myxococcales bacterium]|nr:hypothetical protein [Myxococcales bacterium]
MKRALLICPGRGSYGAAELGTLKRLPHRERWQDALTAADGWCESNGMRAISALDTEPRFRPSLHLRSDVASTLIFAHTYLDFLAQQDDEISPVAVVGNSLGWYSALAVSGAVSFLDGLRMVATTGAYQQGQSGADVARLGGQLIYPILSGDWAAPSHHEVVSDALTEANRVGFAALSIDLGGLCVLCGDEPGLAALVAHLPEMQRGTVRYPMVLSGHSGFHSPLMTEMASHAQAECADITLQAPQLPLIDGHGDVWRPIHADPQSLFDYTFGRQITQPFDFAQAVRTAVSEYAPDVLVLLGPGRSLGGALGQILCSMGWRQLRNKADFTVLQRSDSPILLTSPTAA